MGSLLLDSFQFLGQQLQLSQDNRDDAFEAIRERALRLRQYARDSFNNEDLELETSSESKGESAENSGEYTRCDLNEVESLEQEREVDKKVSGKSLPPIPNIPGVDKEVLTNLLMSWFYAGYYTGLAESRLNSDS